MTAPQIPWSLLPTLALALLLAGCAAQPDRVEPARVAAPERPSEPPGDPMLSVDTLLPAPPDFALERIGLDAYPIPVYAKHLKGVKICLDPGHGGDAQKRAYKRGPTGVREAEVNLRVAQYLRDFLARVGAEVKLTREGDVAVSLSDRAETANEWGADLFISLHHNAVGNPKVNRTSVWYHKTVDGRPSDLDLARALCWGLCDALRLEQTSGIPVKSDQLIYRSGFGVLRHARVTAALAESSFFTHPEEEQRLRDPAYNLREAHGLFVGLARYAAGGLPKAAWVQPDDGVVAPNRSAILEFTLDDGLRDRRDWGADRQMILSDSIAVRVDGKPARFTFDAKTYRLRVDLPNGLAPGPHRVEVQYQNMFKNSVLNPHFTVTARQAPAASP